MTTNTAEWAVRYTVELEDPGAHLLRVRLEIPRPDPAGQVLRLPTWIPGSYLIREFARHVQWLRAADAAGPLAVRRLDKASWALAPSAGPVTVELQVWAYDLSVRAAFFDQQRCYFNGTSLLPAVVGQEAAPCALRILAPRFAPAWRVATTLPRTTGERHGFGDFLAADYDELIDHPVEIADFVLLEFEAAGVPHEVALTGVFSLDEERLIADLTAICAHEIEFFGRPAPMDRYLFQVAVVGDGYGGLEHRSSTSLVCGRDSLPTPGMKGTPEAYRAFLGLCSHEYFHTWNVKRIKPAAFLPYDLTREAHTELLWAFEGLTSYYDDLILVRSGVIDEASYLDLLARTLTGVLRTPGRKVQPVVEASFDAWTRYYRQDENSPNALISYYTKGALVGLTLDLHLRVHSGGAVSLDHLMLRLWERHGRPLIGVPEDGVEAILRELGGEGLQPLLDLCLRSTDELPLEPLLAAVGVELRLRAQEGADDKGGTAGGGASKAPTGWLGATVGGDGKVKHALVGGPAARAGLSAGDQVIALDGLRCGGELSKRISKMQPGERCTLHAFRRDELLELQLEVGAPPVDTAYLRVAPHAAPEAEALRAAWLRGPVGVA